MWRLILVLTLYSCNIVHTVVIQVPAKRDLRLCGQNLADILHHVCKGVYNPAFKKSIPNEGLNEDYRLTESNLADRFPYLQRDSALTFFPDAHLRVARGVYDECCVRSCTLSNLKAYCGSD